MKQKKKELRTEKSVGGLQGNIKQPNDTITGFLEGRGGTREKKYL